MPACPRPHVQALAPAQVLTDGGECGHSDRSRPAEFEPSEEFRANPEAKASLCTRFRTEGGISRTCESQLPHSRVCTLSMLQTCRLQGTCEASLVHALLASRSPERKRETSLKGQNAGLRISWGSNAKEVPANSFKAICSAGARLTLQQRIHPHPRSSHPNRFLPPLSPPRRRRSPLRSLPPPILKREWHLCHPPHALPHPPPLR